MRVRAYRAPLTVLGAGILGFSLFCVVAAAALNGPQAPSVSEIKPQSIVNSALGNISTMAALTVDVITQYVPTPTDTPTLSATITASDVPTRAFLVTERPLQPTKTRDAFSRPTKTSLPTLVPTQTRRPTSVPTSTPQPTATPFPTDTPTPNPTDTPTSEPPTPTDTPVPPPTDTPTPNPTDTPTDAPTATSTP